MLTKPCPGLARRLVGVILTVSFVLAGGCGLWSTQADEPDLPFEFEADRVTRLTDGAFELSGGVVIRRDDTIPTIRAESIKVYEDGRAEASSVTLQLADGGTIVADRITIDFDDNSFAMQGGVRFHLPQDEDP